MQAMEMKNGLWWGVRQAVTYSAEFLPALPIQNTFSKALTQTFIFLVCIS